MLEKCFKFDSFCILLKIQVLSSAIDVGFIGISVKCWYTFRICLFFLINLCGADNSEIDLLYLSNSSLNSLLYQIIWNEMLITDF